MKVLLFFAFVSMLSCSPLLHVTTTNEAKKIWQSHKRIAVVPLKISSPDNYNLNSKDIKQEMENMQKLSYSIFTNINTVLKIQKEKSNLYVYLLSSDSVLQILTQNKYHYNNLPDKNIHQLCRILNVDAVITGNVEFSSPDILLRFTDPIPDIRKSGIEKAKVVLSIYDKNKPEPIWKFRKSNTAKEYNEYYQPSNIINVSNEEYLIAYMFDKAMKALPYVINSPLKRNY